MSTLNHVRRTLSAHYNDSAWFRLCSLLGAVLLNLLLFYILETTLHPFEHGPEWLVSALLIGWLVVYSFGFTWLFTYSPDLDE